MNRAFNCYGFFQDLAGKQAGYFNKVIRLIWV